MRKDPSEYKVQYQNYQIIFAADHSEDLKVVDRLVEKMGGATISDFEQSKQGKHIYFYLYFVGERYEMIDNRMAELTKKCGEECLLLFPISLLSNFQRNFPSPSHETHGVYAKEFGSVSAETLWQYSVGAKGLGKFIDGDISKAIKFIDVLLSKIIKLEASDESSLKGNTESPPSKKDDFFNKIQNFFSGASRKPNDPELNEAHLLVKEKQQDFIRHCCENEDYASLENFAKTMKQKDYISAKAIMESFLKIANKK
jgi:hypothetical protein